jgi:hypothetical protein
VGLGGGMFEGSLSNGNELKRVVKGHTERKEKKK